MEEGEYVVFSTIALTAALNGTVKWDSYAQVIRELDIQKNDKATVEVCRDIILRTEVFGESFCRKWMAYCLATGREADLQMFFAAFLLFIRGCADRSADPSFARTGALACIFDVTQLVGKYVLEEKDATRKQYVKDILLVSIVTEGNDLVTKWANAGQMLMETKRQKKKK